MRWIRKLARDEKGGALIEYGLILALIFVVMMVGMRALALQATNTLNYVANRVNNASGV